MLCGKVCGKALRLPESAASSNREYHTKSREREEGSDDRKAEVSRVNLTGCSEKKGGGQEDI